MITQRTLYKLPSRLFIVKYETDSGKPIYSLRQHGYDIAQITEDEFNLLVTISQKVSE